MNAITLLDYINELQGQGFAEPEDILQWTKMSLTLVISNELRNEREYMENNGAGYTPMKKPEQEEETEPVKEEPETIAESVPDKSELEKVLEPYLEEKPAEPEPEPKPEPEQKKHVRHGRKPTWDTGKAQALWNGGWKVDDIVDELQHGSRPVPTSAAIKTYINNHPEMFPER